jgi:hypothetical protein
MKWLVRALVVGVSIIYVVSGIYEAAHWRAMSDQFVAWGYPSYWSLVTGLTKTAAGALVLLPRTRFLGLIVCSAVGVVAVATVFWTHTSYFYVPALLVTSVTVAATVLSGALRREDGTLNDRFQD